MTLSLPASSQKACFLCSSFLPSTTWTLGNVDRNCQTAVKLKSSFFSVSCSIKIVRSPSLDNHVLKQNKIRFVQKLKTLLLSKPKHFIPIHILSKCRSYLCLPKPHSIVSMICRYPTIFELFRIPTPRTPINATKLGSQLCVRLTPAAAALAMQELSFKSAISFTLATKLQKLLMLSSHRRLLLSKLVHLAPDLGLPPNFRSRLCNDYPDKFKIVDTSYGRALELVTWDPVLANPLPSPKVNSDMIVDRPLKFKQLRLRKGLNLKRHHQDFLIKFGELQNVCPYNTALEGLAKESMEAEKRACGVIREVLAMMVERRTLIDHLTHFRKDFGLPNKLRAMIVRHPELFYVSLKGMRDSVFLVEAFDDKGMLLLEKDEILVIKEKLIGLVREGRRMRRERRKCIINNNDSINISNDNNNQDDVIDDNFSDLIIDDYDDDLENIFDSEDAGPEYHFDDNGDESLETVHRGERGEFWTASASPFSHGSEKDVESW